MKKLLLSFAFLPLFLFVTLPAFAATTTLFSDDFSDADGTPLQAHDSTWYILYGDLNIQNNTLFENGRAYINLPETVDQCASTDLLYPISGVFYLIVRSSLSEPTGNGPFYYAYNNPEDNSVVFGFQPFNSDQINLGGIYLPPPSAGWHRWKLCAVGQQITVYFDSNALLTAQDSHYVGPGTPFIQATTPGDYLDNFLYESITSTPTPTTLFPTADSYLKQGSSNENEGASTFLRLQSSGHNRALLKFDESQIQTAVGSASSFSAKLQLTITDNGNNWGTSGRSIELHRLIQNWIEGNGFIDGNNPSDRGMGSGTTWNCATDSDIHNQASNCSGLTSWNMTTSSLWPFASAATASTTITNNQSGLIELDVTSDVQSFLNNSNQNYGWLIKKTDEGQNGRVEFGSRESANSAKLIITPS